MCSSDLAQVSLLAFVQPQAELLGKGLLSLRKSLRVEGVVFLRPRQPQGGYAVGGEFEFDCLVIIHLVLLDRSLVSYGGLFLCGGRAGS